MGPTTRLLLALLSAVIVLVNSSPRPSDRPIASTSNSTNAEEDTPFWSGIDYPDPRSDPFACNNDEKSPLCDPDQVLTDKWRQAVRARIDLQTQKLKNVKILYTDDAKECKADSGVEVLVVLAKEIDTTVEGTTSDEDLVRFGNSLANKYGLSTRPCRNFVILIGVERPKLVYFKTGAHLKLPEDVTTRVFHQYSPLFNDKNYMDGLNKIIDDIGELMIDPFKPTTAAPTTTTTTASSTTTSATSTTSATTSTTEATTTTTSTTSTTITVATSADSSTSTTPTSEAPTVESTSTFLPPIVIETTLTPTTTTTTTFDQSNGVQPIEPQHIERGEDEDTRRVVVPWWLWFLVVVLISICALAIVVCMAARQRKRKSGAVALQLQTVTAAPSGGKSKVHPTIEHILTARDEIDNSDRTRGHHYNNNNNNNNEKANAPPPPPPKGHSNEVNKRRNEEQDAISVATMSDDGQSQTADARPTTPTKLASKVHINPERLATDLVARKNKAPVVAIVQRDSVVMEAESAAEPTTPTKVAVKVGENDGQQHNDLRRLQSSGDEFIF